jgi:hypothetical protein
LALAAVAAGFLIGRRFLRPVLPSRSPRVGRGSSPFAQTPTPRTAADRLTDAPLDDIERRLDEALEETFPASDPIAVSIE